MSYQTAGRCDSFFHQRFADEFSKFMQRQVARDFPHVPGEFYEQRLLLIELVLNLADEFFQDILQGHHADGPAIFIHDDGQMEFPIEKELQQLLQARRFRRVNDFRAAGSRSRPVFALMRIP